MQARLQVPRFPAFVFALVFALAAALSLGAVLGYTLKPSALAPASTRVIVVQEPAAMTATDSPCVWVDNKKEC